MIGLRSSELCDAVGPGGFAPLPDGGIIAATSTEWGYTEDSAMEWSPIRLSGAVAAVLLAATASAADPPASKTIADPAVAIGDLELLAKPLTRDELIVEANGWLK